MSVYKKISDLREQLFKHDLKKSGKNSHLRFNYFELTDFLPIVIKLEKELGLLSVMTSLTDERAVLSVIDTETGESVDFTSKTAKAEIKGSAIQDLGAVHTYIKRYLYYNYLNLMENDVVDSGAAETQKVETKVDQAKVVDTYVNEISKIKEEISTTTNYNEIVAKLRELLLKHPYKKEETIGIYNLLATTAKNKGFVNVNGKYVKEEKGE